MSTKYILRNGLLLFMQEKIFDMIFDGDEITWKSMLYMLIKKEGMDPWDIDVSLLARKFIKMLKELKKLDFRVSGKVLLAAAVLLKLKSAWLLSQGVLNLDRYFDIDGNEEEIIEEIRTKHEKGQRYPLIPRMPQPRKRKVSIFDLINALEKALEVKKRKVFRDIPPPTVQIPERKVNISNLIRAIFQKIKIFFLKGGKRLTFSTLVPSQSREDKVYTFIPLLHLTNEQKIRLLQDKPFGDIEIVLNNNNKFFK